MIKAGDVNLAMVKRVAELLGPLLQKVVFLGGQKIREEAKLFPATFPDLNRLP